MVNFGRSPFHRLSDPLWTRLRRVEFNTAIGANKKGAANCGAPLEDLEFAWKT